jgi:hypothetical protein
MLVQCSWTKACANICDHNRNFPAMNSPERSTLTAGVIEVPRYSPTTNECHKTLKTDKARVRLMGKTLAVDSPKRRELEGRIQSKDNENMQLQQQLAAMQQQLEESKKVISQQKEDNTRELMEARQLIAEQQAVQERVMQFVVSEQSFSENQQMEEELQHPEEDAQQSFKDQLSQTLLGRSAPLSAQPSPSVRSIAGGTPVPLETRRPTMVFDANTLSEMLQIKQTLANSDEAMTPIAMNGRADQGTGGSHCHSGMSGKSMVFSSGQLKKTKDGLRHAVDGTPTSCPGSGLSVGSSAERVFKSALLQSLASRRMRLAAETPEQGTPCAEAGAFGTQVKVFPSPPGDNGVAQFLVVCSDNLNKVDVAQFEQAISDAVETLDGEKPEMRTTEKPGRSLALSPLCTEQKITDVTSTSMNGIKLLPPPPRMEYQPTKNLYTDCLRSRNRKTQNSGQSCTAM